MDTVLRDFVRTGRFVLEVDGREARGAEIYATERAPALLIVTPELSAPAVLRITTRTVESVSTAGLVRHADASIDVLAGAELEAVGPFELAGQEIRFSDGGRRAVLKPRPDLLGLHGAAALRTDRVEYDRGARAYVVDEPSIDYLRRVGYPVRVRVYFGTWCPTCERRVPPLLEVAEELEGTNLDFEFFGLGSDWASRNEPVPEADNVTGVPTLLVFVDGEEVGRLDGSDGWTSPEAALTRMLGGSPPR